MAENGDAEAQFSLGLKHASAPVQDFAQAEQWYLKAAAQDHPLAHFNLGIMYTNGQLGPCDWAKGLVWIQKAADLGDAGAQYRLGADHHRSVMDGGSTNVTQSRIDACKWFRLAAAQGYDGAGMAGDIVTMEMTREDVQEVDRLITAFKTNAKG